MNIDIFGAPGVSCVFDCRTALPIDTKSARAIYAEHFFEHLDRYEEAPRFLDACLRALQPGGVVRIVVPDAEKYVSAYSAAGWDEMTSMSPYSHPHQPRLGTKMDVLNLHFRQGHQHKWAYDYQTLAALLFEVGFEHVARTEYNTSSMPELCIDSPGRRAESLYVEATA